MAKVRQDAWTHEDDLLLAETVLRHIREGSTQLNAFEEVGDKLNRTSAACGFRWNAEVRSQYHSAIELAKRQRKEKKRREANKHKIKQNQSKSTKDHSLIIEQSQLSIDDIINFLTQLKQDYYTSSQEKQTVQTLQKENESLKEELRNVEKELEKTKKKLKTVEGDYQLFIQIMERARKMTVLDDQGHLNAPTFKMDKNGNLEQFAQGND